MLRRVLMPMLVVLVLSACKAQAYVIHSTWVGGGGGAWTNPSNWNPSVVPDNAGQETFSVTIDSGGGEVHVGLLEDFTINELKCYGTVEIEKRTLGWREFVPTVKLSVLNPKGLTNYGSLELDGEDGMGIVGNVTNAAGSELEMWGILDIENGNLYNAPGAHIEIAGDDIAVEGGALDNRASVTIDPETEFMSDHTLRNVGQIHIRGGQCQTDEVLDNDSTGLIEGFGCLYAEQMIQNKGQIIASNGTLSVLTDGSMTNRGTLKNNAGTMLHVQAGATDLNNEGFIRVSAGGAVTFNCGLNNTPNGTVQLKGGTFEASKFVQNAGAILEGFGAIVGDVVIEHDGIITLTGHTNVIGDFAIEANAELEIRDGHVLITGQTLCDGTIHMKGGKIIPQGGLSGNCNIISEPSVYSDMTDLTRDGQTPFEHVLVLADMWLYQTNWN